MLRIFFSNRSEKLGERLAMELSKPLSVVFRPEIITIQARGMERWLSMVIAEKNGICANFDFCFPKKMISKIIHEAKGIDPSASPFSGETLKLVIFRILEDLEDSEKGFGKEFDMVRFYCNEDRYGLKRFQLAGHIASVFEKYLICRPEIISSWDKGEDENWQAQLWRRIKSECSFPHPVSLMKDFIENAKKGNIDTSIIPERITIFGISSLPPSYISVLNAISEYSEVSIFCLNPCMEYWGNLPKISQRKAAVRKGEDLDEMLLEDTNDLLESMGESLSDFLEVIYSQESVEEHELFEQNHAEKSESLLSFLKSSLLILNNPSSGIDQRHLISKEDDSVSIHSCHSPMRETEVLFDRLLGMFQKDDTLEPTDIIVMMPDINDYGPCVDAVFGSDGGSGTRIPYTLADTFSGKDKKASDCFLSILRLRGSRLGKHEILDIIENTSVSARFGLSEEDLSQIRKWLLDSRLTGEMDENHRKSLGLPGFRENSWAHAIDRLLLGIAMANPDTDSFHGISPFPGLTTSNYGTLSKFLDFWSSLTKTVSDLEIKRNISEWADVVSGLLDVFLDDDESGMSKRSIRNTLFSLKDISQSAGVSQKIDISIITEHLSEVIEKGVSSYGFLTGGVTFCSMLPMRSIPFKVICVLGMNNDSFPRKDIHPGFDLTMEKPRMGDPSIRKDDRQLFLDILISAREKLHISYTGQSIRDNSAIPPSVLVSELSDYIDASCVVEEKDSSKTPKPSEKIFFRHPMHGFSPSCFESDHRGRRFSFNKEYFEAASATLSEKKTNQPFWSEEIKSDLNEIQSISLKDLKGFWKNPCEYAVKRTLGLSFDMLEEDQEISEASMYKGLERHKVFEKNIKLRNLFNDKNERQKKLLSQGLLQHGLLGEITHGIIESEADSVESFVDTELCSKEKIWIDLSISGLILHGSVDFYSMDDGQSKKMIFLRYGSINPASVLLSTWIDFLASRTHGIEADSFILAGFSDSKLERKVSALESSQISVDEAEKHLKFLMEYFSKGLLKPLHFLPDVSLDYARAILKGKEGKDLYKLLDEKFSGYNPIIRPGFYEGLCFGESITDLFYNSDDFRQIALEIFEPVIKAMNL